MNARRPGLRAVFASTAVAVTVAGAGLALPAPVAAAAPTTSSAVSSAAANRHRHGTKVSYHKIARQWARDWNTGDGAGLARLFTRDGTYVDNAYQANWTGRDQIAAWVDLTYQVIDHPHIAVHSVFGQGHQMAIVWTFSGQLRGAPTPFSVPVTTVLTLKGDKISSDSDTYNLAAVLQQSGLPADAVSSQPGN